jgi:hypothetical protein
MTTQKKGAIMNILIRAVSIITLLTYSLLPGEEVQAAISSFQTHHDTIPNFAQNPTIRSAQSGSWSSVSTWNPSRLPGPADVVLITHTVTYGSTTGDVDTIGIDAGGTLRFSTTQTTRLRVGTLLVMPNGTLEVGTPSTPVPASFTAEIVIKNKALNSTSDPAQFGTGLLCIDGKVTMHGAVKTPTFLRLATEPKKGNTTLSLKSPVSGWNVGDRLVIPDTRYIQWNETPSDGNWTNLVNQWEELTIESISADGKTITLTAPLVYDHLGARDLNGVLNFLPHVGNLSRNVKVDSESPTGTRGHALFTNRADVDIEYAWFRDLGRTRYTPLGPGNHIGRYPLHMHHTMGPTTIPANGNQFTLLGNAIDGGSSETQFKWGIAIHNSHYGLIQDNIVYNYNGASIATEEGSESYNLIDHNFAIRGMGEPDDSLGECRMAEGTEGVGFWFRGPNNYVTNNVAANFQNPQTECAYGFVYQFKYSYGTFSSSDDISAIHIPNFQGADTSVTDQYTVKNGNNMPILQNDNNEAYGAMQGGFTYWWIGGLDPQPYANAQESVIKNLKLWNTYNKTVYHYPANHVTFDNLVIRNNYSANAHCCGQAFYFADYSGNNIVIRNSDIQGSNQGIVGPSSGALTTNPNLTVQNTYLRNWTNIGISSAASTNGCWMMPLWNQIINVTFAAPPGRSLQSMSMGIGSTSNAILCNSVPITTEVYSYQGNSSDNFQVYYSNTSIPPRPSFSTTTRSEISGGLLGSIAPLSGGTVTGPTAPTGLTVN